MQRQDEPKVGDTFRTAIEAGETPNILPTAALTSPTCISGSYLSCRILPSVSSTKKNTSSIALDDHQPRTAANDITVDTATFKKRRNNRATSTALDDKPPTAATATDITAPATDLMSFMKKRNSHATSTALDDHQPRTAPATDIIDTASLMKSGNNCATRSNTDTLHCLSCEVSRPQLPQEAGESCDLTLAELPLLTVLAVNTMRCENMKIIHNTEK